MRSSSVEQLQQQSPHIVHSSQTGQHHHQQQQTPLIQGKTVSGNPVLSCHLSRSATSPDQRQAGAPHKMSGTLSRSSQQQTQAQIQHAGTGTAACPTIKQQNCHSQLLICNNVTQHNSKVNAIYGKLMLPVGITKCLLL